MQAAEVNDIRDLGSRVREQWLLIDQDETHILRNVNDMRYILAEVFLSDLLLLVHEVVEPRVYVPPGLHEIRQSSPERQMQPREALDLPVGGMRRHHGTAEVEAMAVLQVHGHDTCD